MRSNSPSWLHDVKIRGWSVDEDRCADHGYWGLGITLYLEDSAGEIHTAWWCECNPAMLKSLEQAWPALQP